ncbi:hypothetical protein [Geodermatophilus sp. URMC 64]
MLRHTLVLITATAFVVTGAPSALAHDDPHGDHHGADIPTVEVVGDGDSVTVTPDSVPAGPIRFEVSTTNPETPEGGGGSAIELFELDHGVTLDEFFADLADQFSEDAEARARSTREIDDEATFHGLADVAEDTPLVVTTRLEAGTYNLVDLANFQGTAPAVTTLTVTDDGDRDSGVDSDVLVTTVDERFYAPRVWPAEGTYSFANEDDTPHFMIMEPVVAGTTDEQVQAALESESEEPPAFLDPSRPSVGNEVVSPGERIKVTYDLPAGTYVLLCFVADEETGMPHAVMGMHLVVELR